MSPEHAGAAAALARLRGEIAADREAMARRVEVPGVRPAILPSPLRADLEALLAARHFLRHAYGAELDGRRLAEHAARIRAIGPAVERALGELETFLAKAIGEAATETAST